MCDCMNLAIKRIKENFGYESVMPQIDLISGKAYMEIECVEKGKKKKEKVKVLYLRCPFCGVEYEKEKKHEED